MVPAEKILRTAKEVNADLLAFRGLSRRRWTRWLTWRKSGASGLHHSAIDWRRDHLKSDTAVKIEQNYSGPTVYVQNARAPLAWWRRCFPILSAMILSSYPQGVRNRTYSARAQETAPPPVTLEAARDNDFAFDWQATRRRWRTVSACRKLKPASKLA